MHDHGCVGPNSSVLPADYLTKSAYVARAAVAHTDTGRRPKRVKLYVCWVQQPPGCGASTCCCSQWRCCSSRLRPRTAWWRSRSRYSLLLARLVAWEAKCQLWIRPNGARTRRATRSRGAMPYIQHNAMPPRGSYAL
eukprot:226478-Chlamydomonas_euryale.AAC.4